MEEYEIPSHTQVKPCGLGMKSWSLQTKKKWHSQTFDRLIGRYSISMISSQQNLEGYHSIVVSMLPNLKHLFAFPNKHVDKEQN